jgi:choline dehydrogenase-like flavoprotein
VATVAAEAGLKVVMLEPGAFITPGQMTQREEQMLPRLLWQAGARMSRDHGTRIHQGKGVGGSSLHNLNLCKRIDPLLLEHWRTTRGLEALTPETWAGLYSEVEALLSVSTVPEAAWNRHNRILRDGCTALGWRGGGLAHNRTGCLGSGFCELGCAFDAKNNAAKVLVPRFVRAGGTVVTHAQAVRVKTRGGRVHGVEAVIVDGADPQATGRLEIEAPRVCVSASATGTPALLLRSGLLDPGGETGRRLRLHPAVVVAGDFDEPVRAWEGIPQTYECSEHLDLSPGSERRLWIVPAFGHPMGVATMLPGHGPFHAELMRRYAHMAVLVAMLHDETAGVVEPDGDLGLTVDYRPIAADRRALALGLKHGARLLFAAGARRVIVPTYDVQVLTRPDQVDALAETPIRPDTVSLSAVHPMGSVPMGADARVAAVDAFGRHHHVQGLWVSDGSLFPTSIGGPPQLSIYALGLHVGRALLSAG